MLNLSAASLPLLVEMLGGSVSDLCGGGGGGWTLKYFKISGAFNHENISGQRVVGPVSSACMGGGGLDWVDHELCRVYFSRG